MEDVTALAKQVARLLRKSGLETYDQTKHVFREVRKELDLSPPKRRGRNTVKRLSVENCGPSSGGAAAGAKGYPDDADALRVGRARKRIHQPGSRGTSCTTSGGSSSGPEKATNAAR